MQSRSVNLVIPDVDGGSGTMVMTSVESQNLPDTTSVALITNDRRVLKVVPPVESVA